MSTHGVLGGGEHLDMETQKTALTHESFSLWQIEMCRKSQRVVSTLFSYATEALPLPPGEALP